MELVIIGGGNMGSALLGGLLAGGADAAALAVCELDSERRTALGERFPGVTVGADVVAAEAAILAVKPDGVPDAARSAVAGGARRLLSIAAGVTTATIEAAIAEATTEVPVAVVRAMPNTPALVGAGAAAIAPGAAATADDLAWAESILATVGIVVRVDESQLDAVTALSGSGPAYLFLVAEALIDAATNAGLPNDVAATLTTQLLVGSGALLADQGDPAALRRAVTSPNGTTAAGLAELEAHGVRAAIAAAVDAAAQRSRELAGE